MATINTDMRITLFSAHNDLSAPSPPCKTKVLFTTGPVSNSRLMAFGSMISCTIAGVWLALFAAHPRLWSSVSKLTS
jgi:hypothetical protein